MSHMSYIFKTYTPCGIRVYGKNVAQVEESTNRDTVNCPKCLEVTK
jgi:hypothetical protein